MKNVIWTDDNGELAYDFPAIEAAATAAGLDPKIVRGFVWDSMTETSTSDEVIDAYRDFNAEPDAQDIQYFVETGSRKSPWGTQLTPPIATESEAIAAAHRQHEIDRTHDHRQPLSVVARWEEGAIERNATRRKCLTGTHCARLAVAINAHRKAAAELNDAMSQFGSDSYVINDFIKGDYRL